MARTERLSASTRFDLLIEQLRDKTSLDSWTSFVRNLQVPGDLVPALGANRPELIKLAEVTAKTPDEVRVLYDLIKGLMETNQALREHAQEVAKLTEAYGGHIKGVVTMARQIEAFANFRSTDEAFATDEGDIDARKARDVFFGGRKDA